MYFRCENSDFLVPPGPLKSVYWCIKKDILVPGYRLPSTSVCLCVYMCISLSRGVPECIVGVKIVTFGIPPGALK